ncbi:hypothetical protein C8R44DRAFT_735011 [Mycena epipterygia]|nr:hypothetical protein C8R44DRAFT_735011 [Mycena epipterygia]
MLQIPSSILSFFSFSKGLAGLCAQATLTIVLSVPKSSLRGATRTTEIVLLPTKCGIPSSTRSFPYLVFMGYVISISASLFFSLRAKGFSSSFGSSQTHPSPDAPMSDGSASGPSFAPARYHNGVGSQPPSPPTEPGSGCSVDRGPRNQSSWLRWLIVALLGLVAIGIGIYVYFANREVRVSLDAFGSFCVQSLLEIEQCFFRWCNTAASWVSAIKTYISIHGWQHSKILLLALTSHSVCIRLVSTFCRARRSIVLSAQIWWFPVCSACVVPTILIASFPQLSWIFWRTYYFGCFEPSISLWPTLYEINQSIICFLSDLGFLAVYDSVDIDILASISISPSNALLIHVIYFQMVIGPMVIHLTVTCLSTVLLGLFGIPATARVAIRELSNRAQLIFFFCVSIGLTAFVAIYFFIGFAYLEYERLIPEIKQSIWLSFSSAESREKVRGAFWWLVTDHQSWKSRQIEDFRELVSGLQCIFSAVFIFGLETWGTLHSVHKLLIFAPAAIYYGYLYIRLARRPVEAVKAARTATTTAEETHEAASAAMRSPGTPDFSRHQQFSHLSLDGVPLAALLAPLGSSSCHRFSTAELQTVLRLYIQMEFRLFPDGTSHLRLFISRNSASPDPYFEHCLNITTQFKLPIEHSNTVFQEDKDISLKSWFPYFSLSFKGDISLKKFVKFNGMALFQPSSRHSGQPPWVAVQPSHASQHSSDPFGNSET